MMVVPPHDGPVYPIFHPSIIFLTIYLTRLRGNNLFPLMMNFDFSLL
jgi:hypothetical protein